MTRAAVVSRPLNADLLRAEISTRSNGATVLFIGTVREVNDGRAVSGMEYTSYHEMAERELSGIVAEAAASFATDDIVVEHRVGELAVGDASVIVAAAHPHRAPAFDACRYVIEELKRRVPIWKLEHYADGSRTWVNQSAVDTTAESAPRGAQAGRV